jgi:transposase
VGGGPLGFADEMRVGLHGMVRRVWGRRGVKVRQRRQIAYRWRHLFLAVDAARGRLHWCWLPALDARETRGVIRGLREATDLAGLAWDRAPAHTDKTVRALGLPLVSLPPSSPELNPAERVFEEIRRAVEGEVYATLEDKVAAVDRVLEEWDADPARVRSLADWDWIAAARQPASADIAA